MSINLKYSIHIALFQTGLLVAGILAVAASNRLAHGFGHQDLRDFSFFVNHGWLLLPVPLAWIAVASGVLLDRNERLRRWRRAVLLTGPALLLVLAAALSLELVEPWRSEREVSAVAAESDAGAYD